MSKHRGERQRDALLGPEPDTLTLVLKVEDAPLIERLLMHYANEAYFNGGPEAYRWRGFSMRHQEARRLAQKVRACR